MRQRWIRQNRFFFCSISGTHTAENKKQKSEFKNVSVRRSGRFFFVSTDRQGQKGERNRGLLNMLLLDSSPLAMFLSTQCATSLWYIITNLFISIFYFFIMRVFHKVGKNHALDYRVCVCVYKRLTSCCWIIVKNKKKKQKNRNKRRGIRQ